MSLFPSEAWCRAAITAVEADPETAEAGEGWEGDFCIVVTPEKPHLTEPFAIYLRPDGARLSEFRVLEDLDEVEEIDPAYVARAPYSVWKGLVTGKLDPIEAVLRRRIEVKGDVQPLIERGRYKGIVDRVLAKVPTEFPDGGN